MIDLGPFRNDTHRTQRIGGVVRGVILQGGLQDTLGLEGQRRRYDQGLRHDADVQPLLVLEVHDVDHRLLQRRFRQVGGDAERVALVAAGRGMRGRTHGHTITTQIRGAEGAVVDVGRDHFLRLANTERQFLGPHLAHHVVLIVLDHFTGDDHADAIHDMRVTGHVGLVHLVITDGPALGLDRSQADARYAHVFLIIARGFLDVEQ